VAGTSLALAGGVSGIARAFVSEPDTDNPRQYARRVRRLALIYVVLLLGSVVGVVLLVWRAQLFVSLAQHSNVETLTLAFLLIFFVYLGALGAPGSFGAGRVLYYDLLLRLTGLDDDEIERRKMAALGPPNEEPTRVALNVLLERQGGAGEPFEVAVADTAGLMGRIVVDGASIAHHPAHKDGSDNLLAFFVHQVRRQLRQRGERPSLDVVGWERIDDEPVLQYLGMVDFARRLERHLGADQLWPKVVLTDADCRELEARLSMICPALRSEGFLPALEYEVEHKLPLIPEPLGLISLSRSERRADPEASMGCAALIVVAVVAALAVLVTWPPWVPSL
jgi:hypothetical protein